MLTLLVDIIL